MNKKPFLNYNITPTFSKVHNDFSRYVFVMGPVGSGKSSGCIMHAFFNALRQPPDDKGVRHYRHLIIMNSYPSLKHTAMKTWRKWFKDKIELTYSSPYTGRIHHALSDGTTLDMELLFMAANTDEAAEKLRSLEVSSCHIGEASNIDKGVFELLQTRIDRYPAKDDGGVVNPFIILDYNAVPTEHWLYVIAEEAQPEGMSFYKQPSAAIRKQKPSGEQYYEVNPEAENLDNLGEEYYPNIIAGSTEESIRTNILNDYGEVRYGKPVYKNYHDNEHYTAVSWEPIDRYPIVIGVDLGLTPAAAFLQQTLEGKIIVFDEITTEDCCLEEFLDMHLIPKLQENYPRHYGQKNIRIFVDPAAQQRSSLNGRTSLSLFRERKLPTNLAFTNSPVLRINSVDSFLTKVGRFQLAGSCPNLRKGFINGYRYANTSKPGIYKENPDKNFYSHIHDALQYAMLYYEFLLNKTKKNTTLGTKSYRTSTIGVGGY